MEKFLEFFCCGKKSKKYETPKIDLSKVRKSKTDRTTTFLTYAPRHERNPFRRVSRVVWGETIIYNIQNNLSEEIFHQKFEEKVEKRLLLTFHNGVKNKWARKILSELHNPIMRTEELVNFELFIIGRLLEDGDVRYLLTGNWIKQWVAYLTLDSPDPPPPIDNRRIQKKILKQNEVIFTVNKHLWNFLKLHYGCELEFAIAKDKAESGSKDPKLWIQTNQEVSLGVFLDCPPWFVEKILDPRIKLSSRRDLERGYHEKYQLKPSEVRFMIPKGWHDVYTRYLYDLTGNVLYPKNLDNSKLFQEVEDENSQVETSYILYNEHMWQLLVSVYEAKPAIPIKKIELRTKNNRVIDFEGWSEEIEIRRNRKDLKVGIVNANTLSPETRDLLCLESLKTRTIDFDEEDVKFEADLTSDFSTAYRSLKTIMD